MRSALLQVLMASFLVAACVDAVPPAHEAPAPPRYAPRAAPKSKSTSAVAAAPQAPVVAKVPDQAWIALAQTRNYRLGSAQRPEITPDGLGVIFLASAPRDPKQSLFKLDLRTGDARALLTPEALVQGSETVSPQERARRERMRVTTAGITSFELSNDGLGVLIPLSGKLFFFDRMTGTPRELPTDEGVALDPHLSPDGKWAAFVRRDDIRIISTDGRSTERAVTTGGTDARPHGVAEFIAQEEFDRHRGFFFSPDGEQIAFEEADQSKVEQLRLADPIHPERDSEKTYYPRAGTPNAELRFGITSTKGGAVKWVNWDHVKYPYVATVRWDKGAPLTLYVLDRSQKDGALLAVDAKTGETRVLLREHDDNWLEVDPSVPRWLPDASAFYWSSERGGGWELEERQVPKGAGESIGRTIVPKEVGYRELLDVDPERKRLVFAGGAEPSEQRIFTVASGGGATEPVTPERSYVQAHFSQNHDVFSATTATLAAFPKMSIHTLGKAAVRDMPSAAERPDFLPAVELRKVGPDQVRVAIVRPRNFVAGAKYPVIDAAYGGPGVKVAVTDASRFIRAQLIADAAGAIVVSLDGKGTPDRSREWSRANGNKLIEGPVDSHIETLKALGAELPELDLSRVGVFGWSFGGSFAATALLRHPDFYKSAVAGAPVADWRDYDTAYSERFLGQLPNAHEAYEAQSLLSLAALPAAGSRPLLLVHGTADDNVYFTHSFKLSDALTRAKRPFEFMPLLGQTHLLADPALSALVWSRTASFLRDALISTEPHNQYNLEK